MPEGQEWLKITAVVARLQEAGFPTSEQTVRRLADDGTLTSRRAPFGRRERSILASSVDDLLEQWRASGPASPDGAAS